MSETDRHVVEKPIVGLCDGFEGTSHDDDHVEEKEGVVFVARLGCSTARFAASIVDGVPLLQHFDRSGAIEVRILQLR